MIISFWNGPQTTDTWGVLSSNQYTLSDNLLYPTMTTGVIYINNTTNSIYQYKIHNMLGQLITASSTNSTIDLSGNQKGMYLIALNLGSNTKTYKVILN